MDRELLRDLEHAIAQLPDDAFVRAMKPSRRRLLTARPGTVLYIVASLYLEARRVADTLAVRPPTLDAFESLDEPARVYVARCFENVETWWLAEARRVRERIARESRGERAS